MKRIAVLGGVAAVALSFAFVGGAQAAVCPTVADSQGLKPAHPQQIDLADFKSGFDCQFRRPIMRRLGTAFILLQMIAACGTPTNPEDDSGEGRFLDPEFAVEVERDIVYATGARRRRGSARRCQASASYMCLAGRTSGSDCERSGCRSRP